GRDRVQRMRVTKRLAVRRRRRGDEMDTLQGEREARPVEVEEGRESLVDVAVEEEVHLPLGKDGELDEADLHLVDRGCNHIAMEIAAVQEGAAGDVDDRVVGRRVELGGHIGAELPDDVDHRAEDLRYAAERINLLDLLGRDVAVLDDADPRLQLMALTK